MKTYTFNVKRIFIWLSLWMLSCLFAVSAPTDTHSPITQKPQTGKKIRVGWYESAFNHTDHKGHRSGYAYEYQQRIAAYTGWEYEYVEGSWVTLFEMLKQGEIDLLSDVSQTPGRENEILFSEHEMGAEDYYISALSSNKDISLGELHTLKGKRIGVNRGSLQEELLRKWAKTHKIDITIKTYDLDEYQYIELLERGEADAIVSVSAFNSIAQDVCIPIVQIGSSSFYFGISKRRPELKNALDKAMSQIRSHSVYYNSDLHEKYFSNTSFYKHFPQAEKNWIKQHGSIRIGYRDNYLPFCGRDPQTGEVSGLLHDFIEKVRILFSDSNLHIEAIPYPTINAAIEAVKKGEVDVAFPNGMSIYNSENADLLPTDPFIKSAEMAVVRSNDHFRTDGNARAAINSSNPNYVSIIKDKYPLWEIVNFSSTQECLEGVASNKADLLLISSYRLSVLNKDIDRLGLKVVATGNTIPLSFATKRGNTQLFSIMSRLTHIMSDSEIHTSLAKYSEIHNETSLMDFVKENVLFVMIFLAVIIGIFLFLFLHSIKQRRIADQANQAKTRFLFNMSHDIRTPMNAIIGYTDLMRNNLDDKEKCQDYLNKVRTSSDFLLGLINNVLEMARIESGRVEIKEEALLFGELLHGIKELYNSLMEKKGITFIYSSDIHTKAIYADQVRLSEIFLNILSNAYKYTPQGGTVTIHTQELPSEKEGYIVIKSAVSDTGAGMAAEFLPHLFEEFSRERTSTNSNISGTGLGMPIVKRLVELMNGEIEVESEVGKGTTFTISIPHRIADASQLIQKNDNEVDTTPFTQKRILLAEDNELNAEIAIEILSAAGFSVVRAADGEECLSMVKEAEPGTYDVILMDIQMPRMNGYDCTRAIRALADTEPAKSRIPIIAMTANAFQRDKKDAMEAGMNGHVAKPIDIPTLMQTLSKVLQTEEQE